MIYSGDLLQAGWFQRGLLLELKLGNCCCPVSFVCPRLEIEFSLSGFVLIPFSFLFSLIHGGNPDKNIKIIVLS